jgi:hypothetical protein
VHSLRGDQHGSSNAYQTHIFPQDPQSISCAAKFRKATGSQDGYGSAGTANFVRRDGAWMHIAATWTAANDGLTTIYQNGDSATVIGLQCCQVHR